MLEYKTSLLVSEDRLKEMKKAEKQRDKLLEICKESKQFIGNLKLGTRYEVYEKLEKEINKCEGDNDG